MVDLRVFPRVVKMVAMKVDWMEKELAVMRVV